MYKLIGKRRIYFNLRYGKELKKNFRVRFFIVNKI